MELYTLTRKFLPKESISQFTSVIWTERYSSAGDVQLVVQPFPSMIEKLAKGTFLGLRGTKEIMMIETQSLENGLLTVTGSSLPKFLNERAAWFHNPAYDGTDTTVRLSAEHTEESITAGQIISTVVHGTVIYPVSFGPPWTPIDLDWPNDAIPGLQLGVIDANGTPKRLSIGIGQLYDSIQQLAQEEGLGFKLYLESSSYATGTYVLRFATYRGKDRTSDQAVNLLIRLSPKTDSLTDVKEVNSISQYKNVFYVSYKNEISIHYIPGLSVPTGFDRRVLVVEAPDIYFDPAGPDYAAKVAAFREQVARNTIANHVYIQAVDGRISQQIGYKFGDDYYLGDIIELEGFTGLISKARVTEYIRSQDQFGEQEYPTLEVLDPLFTGYMPDLEPDPDFDPDWDEDPDYDYDFEPGEEDPETEVPDEDPHDPPDDNPDPEPIFDDETGGNGDGDYEDDRSGGLIELHPANEHDNYTGDEEDSGLGWYQHHDRIYLEGGVFYGTNGDPDGMITVGGGVPVEARPASDTPITIYPDTPNSDSVYGNFTTFNGTVTADGTITISPAPLPSESGIDLYLLFGNLSWPVNPPIDLPPDTVTQESLEPWLIQNSMFDADPEEDNPTATSEGAVIGAHGIRAHLDGEVTLIVDSGNLIMGLPESYRPSHIDKLAIPGGDGWYPAFVDRRGSRPGSVTFNRQSNKPLIRALTPSEWVWGNEWIHVPTFFDPHLSHSDLPMDVWWGIAPEDPIDLWGHWSPPLSNDVGTEFGFILTYGDSELGAGNLFCKVAAEKMGPDQGNQWWMILTFHRSWFGMDESSPDHYIRMPLARLDNDVYFPGYLPGGVNMNVSIEPLSGSLGTPDLENLGRIKFTVNLHGFERLFFEMPQHPGDVGPVWPSEMSADNKWGACYTLMPGTGVPVSILTNITGRYFIPSGSDFYPPTWLPNHGYVDEGYQFNLDGVGWRVGE